MLQFKIIDYAYPTAGELARLILEYKEVQYEDEIVETPDQIYEAEEESPFGVLPILLVNADVVGQQQGICRYLARELGLTGRNNREAAVCDMIMDGLGVMFSKLRGSHISKLDPKQQRPACHSERRNPFPTGENMLQLIKQMMEEDVPRYLDKYEKFLEKENHASGYFASEDLTWCDLGVALTFAGMEMRQPNLLDHHPRLKAFVKKVTSNDIVRHFVETRHAHPVQQQTTGV